MKTKDIIENLSANPEAVVNAVRNGKVPADLKIAGIPLVAEAVAADNMDLLAALVERGANVNAYAGRPAAERGMAPIHFAKSPAAVAALKAAGADIDAPYKDVEHAWGMPGETALHSTLLGKSAQHLLLAEALVKAGANVQLPYSSKEYEYGKDSNVAAPDRVVREGATVAQRLESLQANFGRNISRPVASPAQDVTPEPENAIRPAPRSITGKVVAFGFDDESPTETFYVEIETGSGRQKHLANGPFVPSFENDGVDVGDTIKIDLGADGRIASIEATKVPTLDREAANEGLSEEQRAALATFRDNNGRTWKSKLNDAWTNGNYDKYGAKEQSGLLQQIRNELGPVWLQRMPAAALDAPAAPAQEATQPEALATPQTVKETEKEDPEQDNAIRQATPITAPLTPAAAPDAIKRASRGDTAGEKDKASTEQQAPAAMPATLLNGRFIRDDVGVYRRQGEEREALADEGDKIRFIDKQMDAFQAGVELAKAKGWEAIEVTGSEKFRAEAWYHAKSAGLDVIGYEPNAQDLKRLERRAPEQKVATPAASVEQDAHAKAVLTSRKEAQEFALKKDFGVQTVNTGTGRYSGKLLHETEHHVIQDIGRSTVAVHEKRAFGADHKFDLASKKSLSIGYADGKASVKAAEKARGHAR